MRVHQELRRMLLFIVSVLCASIAGMAVAMCKGMIPVHFRKCKRRDKEEKRLKDLGRSRRS